MKYFGIYIINNKEKRFDLFDIYDDETEARNLCTKICKDKGILAYLENENRDFKLSVPGSEFGIEFN